LQKATLETSPARPTSTSPSATSVRLRPGTVDEAVEIHNDTEYGPSGSVHAGAIGEGMQIAERMETGNGHV
jgi:acyl-CoA reductase-like NAD-dependent aldehyde dehydrogenase